MASADPMDQQHGLVGSAVQLAHDLLNQDMNETLLGPRIGRRCIPCCRQIARKLQETRTIDLWTRRRRIGKFRDSPLKSRHVLQGSVPASLQLAGHMALLRIDQLVPTTGQRPFVLGRLELPLNGGDHVLSRTFSLFSGKDCSFNGAVGDRLENLQSDRTVDPDTSNPDTQPGTDVGVIAAALISMSVAFAHAVEHPHHSSASTAPHEAGQQCASTARRFASAVLFHVCVLEQELLVLLVLLPGDVTRVVVA
jgi:hypothetical protein